MQLHWLAPETFLLLGLALLPILAHLIKRPPKEQWNFGAMMLLKRVQQLNKKRRRIQDWLLLFLRLLVLCLLGVAMMQPQLRWPDPNETLDQASTVVILVDTSLSMAQTLTDTDTTTALEWAKKDIEQRLLDAPEQVSWQVISFSSEPTAHLASFVQGSPEALSVVEDLHQEEFASNLSSALGSARRSLEGKGGEIWLYTDPVGNANENLEEEIRLLVQQNVALVPRVAPVEQPSNLVITEAKYGDGVEGGTIHFSVWNYGASPKETKATVVLPDGKEIHTFVHALPEQETVAFVTVPRIVEGGVASVHIDDARLALDNYFYFHLPKIGANKVLIVDGDPGSSSVNSEVYFLERALTPWRGGQSSIVPDIVSDIALQDFSAESHSVIFLANVSNPGRNIGNIVEFVRSGGGLVISFGNNTDVDSINAAWNTILPTNILKSEILSNDLAYAPSVALPNLIQNDQISQIFAPFSRSGLAGFSKVKVQELVLFDTLQQDENTKVLLSLENGMPLLVEHKVGKGRVLFLTTSIDMDWSNFPLQSVYMPTIQRLVGYLGGNATSDTRISKYLGDMVLLPTQLDTQSLMWEYGEIEFSATIQSNAVVLQAEKSGKYRLFVQHGPTIAWLTLNTPRSESDVRPAPPILEVAASIEPEHFYEKVDIAPWLVLVAIALFLLQSILSAFTPSPETISPPLSS